MLCTCYAHAMHMHAKVLSELQLNMRLGASERAAVVAQEFEGCATPHRHAALQPYPATLRAARLQSPRAQAAPLMYPRCTFLFAKLVGLRHLVESADPRCLCPLACSLTHSPTHSLTHSLTH